MLEMTFQTHTDKLHFPSMYSKDPPQMKGTTSFKQENQFETWAPIKGLLMWDEGKGAGLPESVSQYQGDQNACTISNHYRFIYIVWIICYWLFSEEGEKRWVIFWSTFERLLVLTYSQVKNEERLCKMCNGWQVWSGVVPEHKATSSTINKPVFGYL